MSCGADGCGPLRKLARRLPGTFSPRTRTPAERLGDLSAQLGANEVGAERLLRLVGPDGAGFAGMAAEVLDYGERRMRAALGDLPSGEYRFEDHMEWHDGLLPVRVVVRLETGKRKLTSPGRRPGRREHQRRHRGDRIVLALRSAGGHHPTIPANGGCARPLRLIAPEGSLVGAMPPAAVAAGNVETSQRIADVLLGALAQAAPDRVPAASQGTMRQHPGLAQSFAYYETLAGGQGGRPGRAGQSAFHTGMTNTK